uniref:Uncharacterized protein n=1 Tax=Arion vulgaris TaxID=1028688 RepID=A0A0B6YXA2_9EUPU
MLHENSSFENVELKIRYQEGHDKLQFYVLLAVERTKRTQLCNPTYQELNI